MVTMTIHAEEDFAIALRAYAAELGKSVNQTVKDVFAPILGLAWAQERKESPWKKFIGAMPDIDTSAWDRRIGEIRQVDEEMWK